MNAIEFWYCVIGIAVVSAVWLIVVLLVLDVRVTTQLQTAANRVQRLLVLLALVDDPALPVCPHCGAEAKPLGVTGNGRWFYCTACHTNPWREDARVPERQAVAS
jgi:uncharacterized membrane protein